MEGKNCLVTYPRAIVLTYKVFSINFGGFSVSFLPETIPALLMRISTSPKVSTATLAAFSTDSYDETSH